MDKIDYILRAIPEYQVVVNRNNSDLLGGSWYSVACPLFDLAVAAARCKNMELLQKITNFMEGALQDADESVATAFRIEFIEPLAFRDERRPYVTLHERIRDALGPIAKSNLDETEQFLRADGYIE